MSTYKQDNSFIKLFILYLMKISVFRSIITPSLRSLYKMNMLDILTLPNALQSFLMPGIYLKRKQKMEELFTVSRKLENTSPKA